MDSRLTMSGMTPLDGCPIHNVGRDAGGDAVPFLHPSIKVGMGDPDTQNIPFGHPAR